MTIHDPPPPETVQPLLGVDFTKVHVITPQTRIDVALPSDVLVGDLLPTLLEMSGQRAGVGPDSWNGWQLTSVTGEPLESARTLRAADILDGTVLRLSPARPVVAAPVFDDVVEAIAAAERSKESRSLRSAAGALAAVTALLAACVVLLLGQPSISATASAAVLTLIALLTGTALARTGASPALSVGIGAAAVPAAATAGWLAVHTASSSVPDYPASTTAAALALAAAVLGMVLLGRGVTVFTALGVLSIIALGCAVSGMVWSGAPPERALLISGAIGVALISMAPWISVRLARLPVPVIPTSAQDMVDSSVVIDPGDIGRRSAVASEHLQGIVVAAAITVAFAALVSAASGTWLGFAYAATLLSVLLLRVRSMRSTVSRAGLLGSAIAASAVIVIGAGLSADPTWQFSVIALCLVAMAIVVLLVEVAPRHRLSPAAERGIDILESLLLVAVLPLALGAAQIYSVVRHL